MLGLPLPGPTRKAGAARHKLLLAEPDTSWGVPWSPGHVSMCNCLVVLPQCVLDIHRVPAVGMGGSGCLGQSHPWPGDSLAALWPLRLVGLGWGTQVRPGLQSVGPWTNPVHRRFVSLKLYWHTATPVRSHVVRAAVMLQRQS